MSKVFLDAGIWYNPSEVLPLDLLIEKWGEHDAEFCLCTDILIVFDDDSDDPDYQVMPVSYSLKNGWHHSHPFYELNDKIEVIQWMFFPNPTISKRDKK